MNLDGLFKDIIMDFVHHLSIETLFLCACCVVYMTDIYSLINDKKWGVGVDFLTCIVFSSRRIQSLSSVALYRAVRPRSGKFGVVLKPFPRSAYLTRKTKLSGTPAKTSSSAPTNSVREVESSSQLALEDRHVKEVASY